MTGRRHLSVSALAHNRQVAQVVPTRVCAGHTTTRRPSRYWPTTGSSGPVSSSTGSSRRWEAWTACRG